MRKKDPFPTAFDGLPLLSDAQIGGVGLFLLRVSYLLICSMPLVLSMLDAIAGVAASVLYAIGLFALCVPLIFDIVRKLKSKSPTLDSLLVFFSVLFFVWSQMYTEAVALMIFYHLADLLLCILLRSARKKCDLHVNRITGVSVGHRPDAQGLLHLSDLDVLDVDCRIVQGSAICSLGFLDADAGEFSAEAGEILFAGTQVMEGTLVCEPLAESGHTVLAVRRKLSRCLSSPSASSRFLMRCGIYLQTAYLLFVLMNATFFDLPIAPGFLGVVSVFFCFDFFLRYRRAIELGLLAGFLQKGIFPESIDKMLVLHKGYDKAVFASFSPNYRRGNLSGKMFRVRGRLPRRHFLISEYASEHSALVVASDFALMYRDRDSLLPFVQRCYENSVLNLLCAALAVICLIASLLFLIFTGSVVAGLIPLLLCVLITFFVFSLPMRNRFSKR